MKPKQPWCVWLRHYPRYELLELAATFYDQSRWRPGMTPYQEARHYAAAFGTGRCVILPIGRKPKEKAK